MSGNRFGIKNITKELISTLLMIFVISLVINYIRKPEINENIFQLKLVDIKGKKIDLNEYKEKPLLVHFWATWCPTCKLEASNIESISKAYNVVTIAVNSGSNEAIESYMRERKLTYTVINDTQGALADKFNIEAYPTTLIYDTQGKLTFAEVGYSTTLGLKTRMGLSN